MHKVADGKLAYAQIHIDIKAKKAVFEYPEGTGGWGSVFFSTFLSAAIIWSALLVVAMLITGVLIPSEVWWIPPALFTIWLCVWNRDDVSKFSAFFTRCLRLGRIDTLHIETIRGREYVLPTFGNYYLGYHLQGDFAAYLVSIDILPVYYGIHEPEIATWQAVFKFSKHPQHGCMLLEFL